MIKKINMTYLNSFNSWIQKSKALPHIVYFTTSILVYVSLYKRDYNHNKNNHSYWCEFRCNKCLHDIHKH